MYIQTSVCIFQDVITKWEDYVEEHQGFQIGMAQSMEWVDTLRRRLQVCADLAGDKQDVEDRLTKLQVWYDEKGRYTAVDR